MYGAITAAGGKENEAEGHVNHRCPNHRGHTGDRLRGDRRPTHVYAHPAHANIRSTNGHTCPPTDTQEPLSCAAAQGNCLELTWDGESCTYEGPAELRAGPATLHFHNESEGTAAVNLLRHLGDQSIQDAIDYIGEEPTTKPYPSWSREVGTWRSVAPGATYTWEGVLEPGIHHMVCARLQPIGAWFRGGFTVVD